MKKSTKAALFSALIFPGAGLLLLKLYWRASIFIIPAFAAIWYLFQSFNYIANDISQQIRDRRIHIDLLNMDSTIAHLSQAVQQIAQAQHYQLDMAEWIFIASWLCSIISSYFAGKAQELNRNPGI